MHLVTYLQKNPGANNTATLQSQHRYKNYTEHKKYTEYKEQTEHKVKL